MRRVGEKVPMDECIRRALVFGTERSDAMPLSYYADAIWPNAFRSRQGAAFAASRVVATMEDRGLIRRVFTGSGQTAKSGYQLTAAGRTEADKGPA